MPLNILIVEDDDLQALALEGTLIAAGHRVCGIAGTADDAVDLALQHHPDIALMDIRLSGGRNGIAAALRLRRELQVPTIFVSGHLDATMRQALQACRPLGFVGKPYRAPQLLAALSVAAARIAPTSLRGGDAGLLGG